MRLALVGVILGASTVQAEWWSWIPKTVSTVKDGFDTVKGWFGGNSNSESQNRDAGSEGSDGATSSQPGNKSNINVETEIKPVFEQNFSQPITITSGNTNNPAPKTDPPTVAKAPHSVTQPQGTPNHINAPPAYGFNQDPAYFPQAHDAMSHQTNVRNQRSVQPNHTYYDHPQNGGYNSHQSPGSFGPHPNHNAYLPGPYQNPPPPAHYNNHNYNNNSGGHNSQPGLYGPPHNGGYVSQPNQNPQWNPHHNGNAYSTSLYHNPPWNSHHY